MTALRPGVRPDADAQRFLSILQNAYNYNPGGIDETIRETNNNKVFARGDFNLGKSQLTVRHNYIDADNDIGFPSDAPIVFPD